MVIHEVVADEGNGGGRGSDNGNVDGKIMSTVVLLFGSINAIIDNKDGKHQNLRRISIFQQIYCVILHT